MDRYRKVDSCRVCGSTCLTKYLDFGEVPLANSLLNSPLQTSLKYPIEVLLCKECFLSQLSVVVNPEILFKDYVYHSSISQTFVNHCAEMAEHISNKYSINDTDLIVDIASNDGCLLHEFRKIGFKNLLGIEPASNLTMGYEESGLIPLNEFFSKNMVEQNPAIIGCARIVTAQNVLAHVDNLEDFVLGVKKLLASDGIFIFEVPHFLNLITKNQIDTIYHEHLSYFLLKPLITLFKKCGLTIFDVEEINIHGGSIRVYASKGIHEVRRSVSMLVEIEHNFGLYEESVYKRMGEDVIKLGNKLTELLHELVKSGSKVMGYGASAKGISLINYLGLSNCGIHSIVDETPDKQNKWTPESCIPIVEFYKFVEEQPDYILLLAWNFANEMINKTKHIGAKYIVPIPEVVVI